MQLNLLKLVFCLFYRCDSNILQAVLYSTALHASIFFCRCKCSNCSLKNATNGQECSCCCEEQRCVDKLEEAELENTPTCITLHPGFNSVCLDPWVLETAAVRLKTRANKTYSAQLSLGQTTKARYIYV